ncbi:MAG: PQQ-dependent sugar dehydrogenase [Verrucomicrobiota bacterium]
MLRALLFPVLTLVGIHVAGAQERVPWVNTRLAGSPEPPPAMTVVRAFPKLALKRPVAVDREPGSDRLMVVTNTAWEVYKTTLIRFRNSAEVTEKETLLELPEGELAYGLCFHPKFTENGFFYLGRNGPGPGKRIHSRIVRYQLSREAPWRIVEGSEKTIIEWDSNGHNGAASVFGNDGMLYVTSGDGTSQNDGDNAGQNLASMRSKILRIDVDGAPPDRTYVVPPDNPFVGQEGVRPETWAYGLRNPWRITSDPVSGQIWAGQNGQDLREYANLVQRGANYGWSEYEGSRVFLPGRLRGPAPFTPPTIEHDHSTFRSLTGGFVYRGKRFPELAGAYLYGDYGTGRVWAAKHDGTKLLWNRELADTPLAIAGFGTGPEGDILLADHLGDAIYKLEPAPPPATEARPFPRLLSETGLFQSAAGLIPAAGVRPYEINAPAWHDGAVSTRLMALPGTEAAEFPPAGDGAWAWKSLTFPNGAALAQTLTLPADPAAGKPARRLETRVLLKQDNDWTGYSYVWNAEQTDAALAPAAGTKVSLGGEDEWVVPTRSDCVTCHARGANYALGLTAAQLHRALKPAEPADSGGSRGSGDGSAGSGGHGGGMEGENQLTSLLSGGFIKIRQPDGKLTATLPQPLAGLPRLADPYDPAASLTDRAKAYLATNCAHCHIPEGGGNTAMNLGPWASGGERHLLNAKPQHGDLGLADVRLIRPGDASRSLLPVRVMSRGPNQMPPLGTQKADSAGIQLLIAWLLSLPPDAP